VSILKAVLLKLTVIDRKGKISYLEFRKSGKGKCYRIAEIYKINNIINHENQEKINKLKNFLFQIVAATAVSSVQERKFSAAATNMVCPPPQVDFEVW
jgi:hypothetical protein